MADTIARRRERRRRRKPVWPYILTAVLVALLVIGIVAIAQYSSTELKVKLNGESEITLEYGESYLEPGATASFGDKAVDVTVSGQVQQDKLGTYTISYTANHMRKYAYAERIVHVVDTKAPTIVLVYNENTLTLPGYEYVEEGFVAEDNYDGDITSKVERIVQEDKIIYKVADSSGNTTEVHRSIKYGDVTAPELSLLGDAEITITAGETFTDPGYTATDNAEGDVTYKVEVSGTVDRYKAGTYTITYTVTDNFGNTASATRTVTVKAAPRPPVVEPTGNVIYLTFDDGPSSYTPRLLEILAKYNVKATFFVVGTASTEYYDDIVNAGHAIAIHTNTHDYSKLYASDEAFFEDLYAVREKIYQKTGVYTTLMRFPGGSSNRVSKSHCKGIMSRLTKAVEAQGFQYFDWNVDSNDAGGAKTSEEVFQNVIKGVKGRKYSIVLQHDIHKFSVEAVDDIIEWGLANGYTFEALTPSSPTAHHKVNN